MKRLFRYALIFSVMLTVPGFADTNEEASTSRFVATYFYTNVRCPSCLTIERWTSKTIQEEFTDEVQRGVLEWRTVNLDGEGNFHYVKDYNLYTKSVIISEIAGGEEVRWKNLPKVWELLKNEDKFRKYVRSEVSSFMEQH